MSSKKPNIGRSNKHARQLSASRAAEIFKQRDARRQTDQIRAPTSRTAELRHLNLPTLT